MKRFVSSVTISTILGLGLAFVLLAQLNLISSVNADTGIRYVALDGVDANDCSSVETRCKTVQRAVDIANPGDLIKVAMGTYSDIGQRPSAASYNGSEIVTQVVYISTAVSIRGGYTTTNAFMDPPTTVSTLSPQGLGRGMYIAPGVTVTLAGLHLVDGNAVGLGGGGAPSYQDSGGGLYADRASVTISECLFAQNLSTAAGGIYINRGTFVMQRSMVTDNVASSGNAGGLSIYSPAIATVSGNSILSNTAASNGGGLYLAYGLSDTKFFDNILFNNTAGGSGGGIFMNSEATINNNQVMSNSAGYRGGGLYVNGSSPLIEANQFIGNYGGGGGVFFLLDTAKFRANTVISNTSDSDGGGLLIHKSEGLFENNIVAQNQLEGGNKGAGIFIGGGSPHFVHTTLAQNVGGDGSGVYISDESGIYGSITLTNTILVSHTTGLHAESGNTALINGVLWHDNMTVNIGGSGTVTVNHAYTGFPAFVNPDRGDYHINSISAAINKGVSAGVLDDIDGDLRLGNPDLGADEFVRQIYLPTIQR